MRVHRVQAVGAAAAVAGDESVEAQKDGPDR